MWYLSCKGNIAALGEALTSYWSHKKHIAPGCEPNDVKIFMDHMAPFVFGQSLAGAGGIHLIVRLISIVLLLVFPRKVEGFILQF